MTVPSLTPLAQQLRQIAQTARFGPLSDRELLERFVASRDRTVLEALVRRHGGLVLAACRQVLAEPADVEDAFQATFLLLLQKAGSVQWRPSLGNWLFGAAHRIAVRVRANAVRRRQCEAEAGRLALGSQPPPDLSWREAVEALHEELDRLPDRYRLPLLLCYLQGKSRDEAAEQLGWTPGSLKGRLERGRELLRQRLVRRGITLSAGLLGAVANSSAAGALPPRLVQATLTAATSGPRAAVAALTGGVSAMLTSKVKLASVLVLILGLFGAGAAALRSPEPAAGAAPPAAKQTAAVDNPPSAPPAVVAQPSGEKDGQEPRTFTGRVLDPDGKPVANARLYWPRLLKDQPASEEDVEFPARGATGADGRFRLELPRRDLRPELPFKLLALADSYGMGWTDLPRGDSAGEVTIRLVKDQPVRGRVLDTEGRPLAGAEVRVQAVLAPTGGKLDGFLTAWKAEWRMALSNSPERVFLPPVGKLGTVKADKDGRFEINGIGAERVARLKVSGPGIAQTTLFVVSRPGFDPEPFNKAVRDRTPPELRLPGHDPQLYGPALNLVAALAKRIEGTLREAKTGKPLAGVRVRSLTGYDAVVEAVTDKEGRFRLDGLHKQRQYLVHAEPPAGSAYLRAGARVDDTPGYEPLKVELTMARGVVLTGRVLDRTTGKGVRSGIRFAPLPENEFFGKPGYDSYKTEKLMHDTDAEGRFRLTVIPGPGVLMAQAAGDGERLSGVPIKPYKQAEFSTEDRKRVALKEEGRDRYYAAAGSMLEFLSTENAVKVLDLQADAGTVACDLIVDRGQSLAVKLQDAGGEPLAGAIVSGMTASWPITFSLPEARCTIHALDPEKPRRVVFYHPERKLAGTLLARGDEKEPPAVKLGPTGTVTGRILDLDGQAVTGVEVRLSSSDDALSELYRHLNQRREPARTDKDGRFRLEGVVPGVKFYLGLSKGRTYLTGEPAIGLKEVASGKILDLGDIRTRPRP
jgi:RNA polymerase sigma factor (sigma-70 family)